MTLPSGFCTEQTFTFSSYAGGTTGSSCGSGSGYVWATLSASPATPSGQHYMRIELPGFTCPASVCVSMYGDSGADGTEHNQSFAAGSTISMDRSWDSGSTHFELIIRSSDGNNAPYLGQTWHVYYKNAYWESACGPPPPPCQYGTRAKSTSPLWGVIGSVALSALASRFGLNWFEQTILTTAYEQIDITELCSSLPPAPPPPPPEALNYPPYKLLQWLYPMVWDTFCECTPGSTTPINPPDPDFGTGTGFQQPRVIVVNPTNPCLDITEVRAQLDRLLMLVTKDVDLDQLLQRYSLPFATVRGATHSGLVGTGSFSIPRCVGVQITVTSRIPGRILEGSPEYVWDIGWASLMDGNGFIQERRITRDEDVWMPRGMQEATTFGYVFKDGVVASVTELYAES